MAGPRIRFPIGRTPPLRGGTFVPTRRPAPPAADDDAPARPEPAPHVDADPAPPVVGADRVRIDPPPIAPRVDPLADPEPPFASAVPASITDPRERAKYLVRVVHAHVILREKSFHDSGNAILELMKVKHLYGAADIKELCEKAKLPVGHMTAQKYMTVARIFDRETALRLRCEKAYLLTLYAQATDRRPEDARAIARTNEKLEGVGVGAATATLAQIRAAIAAAEKSRAEAPVPVSARDREAVVELEALLRTLGFAGSRASIDEDGHVDVRFSIEKIRNLRDTIPEAVAKWVKKLGREDPRRFAPFAKLGVKPPKPR